MKRTKKHPCETCGAMIDQTAQPGKPAKRCRRCAYKIKDLWHRKKRTLSWADAVREVAKQNGML